MIMGEWIDVRIVICYSFFVFIQWHNQLTELNNIDGRWHKSCTSWNEPMTIEGENEYE